MHKGKRFQFSNNSHKKCDWLKVALHVNYVPLHVSSVYASQAILIMNHCHFLQVQEKSSQNSISDREGSQLGRNPTTFPSKTPVVGELSNHDEGKPNQWGVPCLPPYTIPLSPDFPNSSMACEWHVLSHEAGSYQEIPSPRQAMLLARSHFSLRRRLIYTNSTNSCIYLVPHSNFQFYINSDFPFLPAKLGEMELTKLSLVLASYYRMFADGGKEAGGRESLGTSSSNEWTAVCLTEYVDTMQHTHIPCGESIA